MKPGAWILAAAALLLAWEGIDREPGTAPRQEEPGAVPGQEEPGAVPGRTDSALDAALDAVAERFHALEREALRQAEALAPAVLAASPSLAEDAPSRAAIFDALRREMGEGSPPVFGAAVVDRDGRPLAWWGRINSGRFQGPPGTEPSTRAFQSAVYRVVRAEVPLTGPGGDRAGAVRTFAPYHASLPLHNRYLRPLDFEAEAEEALDLEKVDLEFDPAPAGPPPPLGPRSARRPLEGILGTRHGTLEVTLRPPEEAGARAREERGRWRRGLLGGIVLLALLGAGGARGCVQAGLVLAARGALLLLDVPGELLRGGLFDPSLFSVPGFAGALGSPGDALLTAAAGLAAVLLLLRELPRSAGPAARAAAGIAAVAAAVGGGRLLLALATEAAFRSRVGLLPEDRVLPHAAAVALLLAPGIAAAAGLAASHRLLCLALGRPLHPRSAAGAGLALAVAGGLLAGGAVQWEILQALRADALAALGRLEPTREREERAALAGLLGRMAAPDGLPARVLRGGGQRPEEAAFYAWAETPELNGRPDGCTLEIVRADGRVVSRFDIDSPPGSWLPPPPDVPPAGAAVEVRPGLKGAAGRTFLVAAAPVRDAGGALLGSLRLALPAGFPSGRGLTRPEILRNYGGLLPPPAEREIHVSTWEGDRLADCSLADIPRGRRAPAEAVERVLRGGEPVLWTREEVAGVPYHEAFLPRAVDGRVTGMVSVAFPSLTARPLLLNLSKVLLLHLLAALAIGAAAGAAALARGGAAPPAFGFRAKVLAGFILVGAVPVAGLALLERSLAEERAREAMDREMGESLGRVEASLRDAGILDELLRLAAGRAGPVPADEVQAGIPDDRVKEIAWRAGVPVNLYLGDMVVASSERGIFATELFSRRLPGSAYEQIVLLGRGSYLARERFGSYPFLVGYAPVRGPDGTVAGVISVPLLFRQDQADRDLARTTTVALGLYVLVLLGVAAAGLLLARRMARPVEALSEGTRRVAAGDLRTRIPRGAKDELGALVDSFNRMTEGLEAGREAEIRAEREAAWREMAKQVAHEIKNPLTPMRLHAQHLLRAQEDGSPDLPGITRKAAEVILRQAEALQRISTDFAAFARLPRRRPESLDLGSLAREIADLYRVGEGIEVTLDVAENLPPVTADREEMRLVLVNLCGNAMEAMPEGGRLSIRLRHEKSVLLEVEDTGVGIAPEDMARLFDPAFSTKTRGTGLGLAIVKRAVEDTGGTIAVRSEPGKGSVFTVTIPA